MGRVGRVVRGTPVNLQVLSQVLTGILQLVLIQDHIKELLRGQARGVREGSGFPPGMPRAGVWLAHRGTLHQLVSCHHLHVEVLHLGLAPGLDEPLQDLARGQGSDSTTGGSQDPQEPWSPLTLGDDTLT